MSESIPDTTAAAGTAAATAIHGMVDQCRANACPTLVARLRSGWVIMGERQVLGGYCLLLPDPVVDHLNALAGADRMQFLADMALTGDAIRACTDAVRINYAIFGNLERMYSRAWRASPPQPAAPSPGRSTGTPHRLIRKRRMAS
jgi:hypothetical protein